MKILSLWLRTYVPHIPVDDHQLAEDLTLRGIAVEGVHDLGARADGNSNGHIFEMDITTNRVDAMNHYGIAREAATIYNLPLATLNLTEESYQPESALFPPQRRDPRILPEAPPTPNVQPNPSQPASKHPTSAAASPPRFSATSPSRPAPARLPNTSTSSARNKSPTQ